MCGPRNLHALLCILNKEVENRFDLSYLNNIVNIVTETSPLTSYSNAATSLMISPQSFLLPYCIELYLCGPLLKADLTATVYIDPEVVEFCIHPCLSEGCLMCYQCYYRVTLTTFVPISHCRPMQFHHKCACFHAFSDIVLSTCFSDTSEHQTIHLSITREHFTLTGVL